VHGATGPSAMTKWYNRAGIDQFISPCLLRALAGTHTAKTQYAAVHAILRLHLSV